MLSQEIWKYVEACEENIVKYKAMGDEKAVKAAEGMIVDFKQILKNYSKTS